MGDRSPAGRGGLEVIVVGAIPASLTRYGVTGGPSGRSIRRHGWDARCGKSGRAARYPQADTPSG